MSEYRRRETDDPRTERDWADRIHDPEDDDEAAPYEQTYRDGSMKNECWGDQ